MQNIKKATKSNSHIRYCSSNKKIAVILFLILLTLVGFGIINNSVFGSAISFLIVLSK